MTGVLVGVGPPGVPRGVFVGVGVMTGVLVGVGLGPAGVPRGVFVGVGPPGVRVGQLEP